MKLQQSTNYSQFELLSFNRDVKKTRELEESMKEHGWIPAYPAHVVREGNKLKVKGGHHRITVAQKLGLPITYVVCNDNASVHQLEKATVDWSMGDYLTSYVRMGDPDYVALDRYQKRTKLPLSCLISMLSGESATSNNFLNVFKSGEFAIKDTVQVETVNSVITALRDCKMPWALDRLVVQAVSRIVVAGCIDISTLIQKIKANPGLLQKQARLQQYTEMFEEVYNRNAKKKIPLAFMTDEAMKERQRVWAKSQAR